MVHDVPEIPKINTASAAAPTSASAYLQATLPAPQTDSQNENSRDTARSPLSHGSSPSSPSPGPRIRDELRNKFLPRTSASGSQSPSITAGNVGSAGLSGNVRNEEVSPTGLQTDGEDGLKLTTGGIAGNRKNVAFTPGTQEVDNAGSEARTPAEEEKAESARPHSLYSKLRALAVSQSFTHARAASATSIGGRSVDGKDFDSPRNRESGLSAFMEEDNSDADADAEESPAEGASGLVGPKRRRRKSKRLTNVETAPSSPQTPLYHSSSGQGLSSGMSEIPRPNLIRSATDGEMTKPRQGVSEDEGTRHSHHDPWTPRHPLRGLSYGAQRRTTDMASPGGPARRPLTMTGLSKISSHRGEPSGTDNETPKPSRRKQLTERGSTLSAAKWKQIKNSFRLLGQGRKKEKTQDQQKSAELLAELAAGSPAALMIASMFQRDEHGSRRIPVLLEQLKVSITDSELVKYKDPSHATPGDRHIIFRIELEYGNGINRMRWVVRRSLADFASLHVKYKLYFTSQKLKGRRNDRKQMPRFPREVFQYAKALGDYKDLEDEEGEEDVIPEETGVMTDTERPGLGHRHRTSFALGRRRSSIGSQPDTGVQTPGGTNSAAAQRREQQRFEKQRKALEVYLQRMIQFMLFRADANRLCKFLEVSALGMRLAAEGSYHGKEGFLVIRSAKGLDFRKALTPSNVKARHAPKWFLVRHSYIVCVDSPEGMNIYDVFLFDSDFNVQSSIVRKESKDTKSNVKEIAASAKESAKHPQHHRLKVSNSERRLKLLARNERQLFQFEESIRSIVDNSPWTKQNRFDSFAPVRPNCFAQWLVDGRDHMWVVSRALNQAKDVIYIHDWWLSPELYMRRPPAISQKWRLDRILKRKAEQGVKIFVIVYRNIDAAIPIDSQYTKFSLLDLHPNIFVQRSPNQFRQNTFFWAHHEKLCIVDHTLAFVGGIDLCFGRWDTPQHILIDDKPTGFNSSAAPKDADHCQLWPGKDYSNPRIQDFYALNKPYEEMYDRSVVPRMPWHDISMQVVGQPARDLTRHFVQRWNYILRQRKPTRPTPFLLPPPDFNAADLEALGLDGTCEVQILRSAGPWSIGTPDKTEHSIMNAYVKMIEESEHFVYMENQFFISSCETEVTTVHNKIGDAFVERICRAARNDEAWRAVIVIPLIPGFQNTVEQEGGTSVRLIMQYQYRSICRGETSIFGRLKAQGIEPEEYIQFYSLRTWGRLGPRQSLITEQLYIHAKCMVVDDRVAIIGSANVNERSMLGNRDSECAAVVRDTDTLWSRMNGQPYRVSRFAHTLRMRLMREHLGLDVDEIMEEAQAMETEHRKHAGKEPAFRPQSHGDDVQSPNDDEFDELAPLNDRGREIRAELLHRAEELSSFNHDVDWEQADNPNLRANRKLTEDPRVTNKPEHRQDIEGEGFDHMAALGMAGFGEGRDTAVTSSGKEMLATDTDSQGLHTVKNPRLRNEQVRLPSYVVRMEAPAPPMPPKPALARKTTEQLGLAQLSQLPPLPELDDSDIGGPGLERLMSKGSNPLHHFFLDALRKPLVDRDCMQDPIIDSFIDDTWHTVAENNTRIYRAVFRCMPDNQVRDWNEYHQYMAYEQRFNDLQGNEARGDAKVPNPPDRPVSRTGPPGVGASGVQAQIKNVARVPSDLEKASGALKEKVRRAVGEDIEDNPDAEKTALRDWAAQANRAQMQRQGTDLTRRSTFEQVNEKVGLHTVPEHSPPQTATSKISNETGSETQQGDSPGSGSNTAAERPTSQPQTMPQVTYSDAINANAQPPTARRRRRGTTKSSRRDFSAADDILSIGEAEDLLNSVQGNLVEWPYDWLEKVEAGSNWLFPFDQISPIEIYI